MMYNRLACCKAVCHHAVKGERQWDKQAVKPAETMFTMNFLIVIFAP